MQIALKFAIFFSAATLCAIGMQSQQPADTSPSQSGSQTPANSTVDKKPKKVWTDEDLHKLGGVSVVGSAKAGSNSHNAATNGSKDYKAASYKQQLIKLQSQLDDANKKLTELQNFNGDSSSNTGIQTNHRLNRASVADQIAQLETRKSQIVAQMQNIFDQARHEGIEPGALR